MDNFKIFRIDVMLIDYNMKEIFNLSVKINNLITAGRKHFGMYLFVKFRIDCHTVDCITKSAKLQMQSAKDSLV